MSRTHNRPDSILILLRIPLNTDSSISESQNTLFVFNGRLRSHETELSTLDDFAHHAELHAKCHFAGNAIISADKVSHATTGAKSSLEVELAEGVSYSDALRGRPPARAR